MTKGTFKINLKPVAQRLVITLMIIVILMIIMILMIIVILMIMMTKTVKLVMIITRFNSWRGKKSFEKSSDSDPKTASKKVDLNSTHATKNSYQQ